MCTHIHYALTEHSNPFSFPLFILFLYFPSSLHSVTSLFFPFPHLLFIPPYFNINLSLFLFLYLTPQLSFYVYRNALISIITSHHSLLLSGFWLFSSFSLRPPKYQGHAQHYSCGWAQHLHQLPCDRLPILLHQVVQRWHAVARQPSAGGIWERYTQAQWRAERDGWGSVPVQCAHPTPALYQPDSLCHCQRLAAVSVQFQTQSKPYSAIINNYHDIIPLGSTNLEFVMVDTIFNTFGIKN